MSSAVVWLTWQPVFIAFVMIAQCGGLTAQPPTTIEALADRRVRRFCSDTPDLRDMFQHPMEALDSLSKAPGLGERLPQQAAVVQKVDH